MDIHNKLESEQKAIVNESQWTIQLPSTDDSNQQKPTLESEAVGYSSFVKPAVAFGRRSFKSFNADVDRISQELSEDKPVKVESLKEPEHVLNTHFTHNRYKGITSANNTVQDVMSLSSEVDSVDLEKGKRRRTDEDPSSSPAESYNNTHSNNASSPKKSKKSKKNKKNKDKTEGFKKQ